jgi:hypothetical protein
MSANSFAVDEERHAFRFSMLNGDQVVICQISDAALDELAGVEGTESSAANGAVSRL